MGFKAGGDAHPLGDLVGLGEEAHAVLQGPGVAAAHHIGELGAQGAAVPQLGFQVFQVLGDAGIAARHIAAGGADFLNPAQAVPVQGSGQVVAGRAGLRQRRFQAVEAGGHGQGGGLLRGARVAPQGFESQ